MKHINREKLISQLDWKEIKKLKDLETELKALSTIDEKKSFIDSNDSSWREIKENFRAYSNDTCWICETDTVGLFGDLEHYRPKKGIEGIPKKDHAGYWWLAFDIHNFLYSCKTCNSKLCDDGIIYGKGNLFGLLDEEKRVNYNSRINISSEEPLFLNPYKIKDIEMINFNLHDGKVIPNIDLSNDSIKRVDYTAKNLLNRNRMNIKRLEEIKELLNLLKAYKDTRKELKKHISPENLENSSSILSQEKAIKEKISKDKKFFLAKYYCLKQKNRRLFDKLDLEIEDITYDDTEQFIENLYTVNISTSLKIDCKVKQDGFRKKFLKELKIIKKNKDLTFFIEINKRERYDKILWKVKNVGKEAKRLNNIRGQIFNGGDTLHEKSLFKGKHFVECYIIKDDMCIARDKIDVPISS